MIRLIVHENGDIIGLARAKDKEQLEKTTMNAPNNCDKNDVYEFYQEFGKEIKTNSFLGQKKVKINNEKIVKDSEGKIIFFDKENKKDSSK